MTQFSLKQLKYFITVVETESFVEASRQLHIAQPSLSIAIKNLEESFGQQLLIRHHAQGISLHPGGKRFYEKAKALLHLAHEFEQNSHADNALISGKIAVGCFESAAPLYMPKLLAGFKKIYPNITVQLYDGEQHEIMLGLQRSRFDLAFLYDLELGGAIHKERLKAPDKPYALLSARHPLARRKTITLQTLSREPMILLDTVPSKNYFLNLFKAKGYHPEVAYSTPSIEMVRCMVGKNLGFSLLVTRPVNKVTYDGETLAYLEIEDEMEASSLIMAWLKNNAPTRPSRLFIDYCRTVDLSQPTISTA